MSSVHTQDYEDSQFAIPSAQGDDSLTEQVLHDIRKAGTRLFHSAETIIALSGDAMFDAYFIESGRISLVYIARDGRERTTIDLSDGAFANLACAAAKRNASGQFFCTVDAVVWRIPGKTFWDPSEIQKYPNLAAYALSFLGRLTLTYSTSLTDMLIADFVVRLCRYLVSLARSSNALEFPLGMTQDSCASHLGVHRATLGRAVQQLKQCGILGCFTKNRVQILDMERMAGVASTGRI